jgi:hypothetical protein
LVALPSFGQWLSYPTSGVPRTADGKPNLSSPAPRNNDGMPDFSGMWGWVNIGPPCGTRCTDTQISREFLNIAYSLKDGPPYQPWAAELVKKQKADLAKDDPNVRCMPRAAPRIWTDDYYKRIFHAPGCLIILTERNMQYRQIFTDGRPLPLDPNPIGNNCGFQGRFMVRFRRKFSYHAKMTEKIRRPNYGTLEVEITIDDPKAYTAPWTGKSHNLSCSIANSSIITAWRTRRTTRT